MSVVELMYLDTADRGTHVNDDQYATIRAPEQKNAMNHTKEPVYAPVDPRETLSLSQHYEFDSNPVPNPMYRVSGYPLYTYVIILYIHTIEYTTYIL